MSEESSQPQPPALAAVAARPKVEPLPLFLPHEPRGDIPDFLGEALGEVQQFARTAAGMLFHPVRFTRDWAGGGAEAMNPLSFFGAAVGARLAINAVLDHFLPASAAPGAAAVSTLEWLAELAAGQTPLLLASLFAWILHRRLRKKGSTLGFRGTLGAVFFAEGMDSLLHAVAAGALLCAGLLTGHRVTFEVLDVLDLAEVWFLVMAVVGAHRLTRTRAAVGPVLVSLALSAVVGGLAVEIGRAALGSKEERQERKRKKKEERERKQAEKAKAAAAKSGTGSP